MSKPGKRDKTEHWTKLIRSTMEEPAWRALKPMAQALYPWLKLEWRGPNCNNNGKLSLSTRQAASRLGVTHNAAASAFHDLQAKGFIVLTKMATLGSSGQAKSPTFEITELSLPHSEKPVGRKLYKEWREGADFPVQKSRANNPDGINNKTKTRHRNKDRNVIKIDTYHHMASQK